MYSDFGETPLIVTLWRDVVQRPLTETETCQKYLDKGNLHRISSTGPSTDIQRDLAQELLHKSCQGDLARDHLQELAESTLVSLRHDLCSTVWDLLPGYFFTGSAIVPCYVRFNFELDTKAEGLGLVVFLWCLGGVSVVFLWCLGGVSVVPWWCFCGALVVFWWCLAGVMLASCNSLAFICV